MNSSVAYKAMNLGKVTVLEYVQTCCTQGLV